MKKKRIMPCISISPMPIKLRGKSRTYKSTGTGISLYDANSEEKVEITEEMKKFKIRYEKESILHLEEIDFIITNLIDRSDFKIEKDYDTFNLRKEDNKGYIYLRIGKEQITVECNDNITYNSFQLQDKTLYQKWYSKLEDKYFEYNNKTTKATKATLNLVCNLTNLKRKTKIAKLIEEDNNK